MSREDKAMNQEDPGISEELLFDWDGSHQSTIDVNALLSERSRTTRASLPELWVQRAVKLAQLPPEDQGGEKINLVLFRLGRETYGLEAQYVRDIKPLRQVTPVPRVPNWVVGVINLRGRILSVVDLARFLGLSGAHDRVDGLREQSPEGQGLIVAETPDMEVGLLVSEVLHIKAVPIDRIENTGGTMRGLPPEYVRGVIGYEGESGLESAYAVVLNINCMLADERLIIHEEVN